MKRLLILLVCSLSASLLFGGCQNYSRNKKPVEVVIEGGGEFPQSLAGKWEANEGKWQLVFEPNGALVSAIVPITSVEIRPNQTTRVQGHKGEPGFFEAGNFTVCYNSEIHELSVNIKIKQAYLEIGGILKGPWEYFVIGNISEDGKTWWADVFTSMDWVVLVPDPNHIGDKSKYKNIGSLRSDFDAGGEHIIFTKGENAHGNK